jgi:plastocyanin
MIRRVSIRRVATALAVLAGSTFTFSQSALAQTAPAGPPSNCASMNFKAYGSGSGSIIGVKGVAPSDKRTLVVTITDSGFDAPCYNFTTWVSPDPNPGRIQFVNKGTMVHTATALPGTSPYGASITQIVTGAGQEEDFGYGDRRMRAGTLDTGGIDPGGSVTMAFQSNYTNAPAGTPQYLLTSATDCLYGNATPGFNCNPVPLYIHSATGDDMAVGVDGSTLGVPGSPDCIRTVNDGAGNPICWTASRKYSTLLGSFRKPVGDFTVTIDDIKGYQPNFIIAKAGSTMTLINKGNRVHNALTTFGPRYWFQQLDSGGLAPGDTYQFTFGCNPATVNSTCGTYFQTFTSFVVDDLATPDVSGATGSQDGCIFFVFRRPGPTCGVSAFAATVATVP